MLTKAILICSLLTYLTNAAVIRGDNFPVYFQLLLNQFSFGQVMELHTSNSVQLVRVSGRGTSTTARSRKSVGLPSVADLKRSNSTVFSEDSYQLSMIPIQVLWVHNDSGGSTWINAISEHGQKLALPSQT